MEGAALAEEKRIDMAMITAWHTAAFVLGMYSGEFKKKGRKLSDFLSGDHREKPRRSQYADAHAFFSRLQAAGVPVETKH